MKRILCLVLSLVILLSLSAPAAASEISLTISDSPLKISPRGVLSLSASLAGKGWIGGNDIYYVHDGNMTIHITSCTWSPASQGVKIGLHNISTRENITTNPIYGGKITSQDINTIGVPAGDYTVCIVNASSTPVTIAMSYSVTIS